MRRPRKPTISTTVKASVGGIAFAVVTAIAIALATDWLSITESKLVHVGGKPLTPTLLGVKEENGKHVLYIETQAEFRNYGFRRGYIADVKVIPDGPKPYPEEVRIIEWDKEYIPFMRKQSVHSRFVAIVNPQMEYPNGLQFKVNFYGQSGNKIYWERLIIEVKGIIPFVNPQIAPLELQQGQALRLTGRASDGSPYDLRYKVEEVKGDQVMFRVDGTVGTNTFQNISVRLRLEPNKLVQLSRLISFPGFPENLFVAVIDLSPKPSPPGEGKRVDLAYGAVRDTVPPPPPRK